MWARGAVFEKPRRARLNGGKQTMSANKLIYVAGNPDLYPLEYYDPETESYQGAIPQLLAQFAEAYGYDLRYYLPGEEDRRVEFAENLQVDVISGCVEGERFDNIVGEPVAFFFAGGEQTPYRLLFTRAAPEGLQEDLRAFAQEVTQLEGTQALKEGAPRESSPAFWPVVGTLGAAVCLLFACLVLAVRRYKNKIRKMRRRLLHDEVSGLESKEYLQEIYTQKAGSEDRVLYHLVYFRFANSHIERLGGQNAVLELQRHAVEVVKHATSGSDEAARLPNGDLAVLKQAVSAQAAEEWAAAVLKDMRTLPQDEALIRSDDVVAGIFPLETAEVAFDSALFYARQAAFDARIEQTDCKVCNSFTRSAYEEERQLLADFDSGLQKAEFQIYLQFVVDAQTFERSGAEALSRWQHPTRGLLAPAAYVPLLEREGRIESLDHYNFKRVCAFLNDLARSGVFGFRLSCNFSRRTFSRKDFVGRCAEVIERCTFNREDLALEVTESQFLNAADQEQMLKNIEAMRAMGVQVIFDDFGMGFSSFRDLQEYPMDGLKLDKDLVDHMSTERGRVILSSLVQIAHELGARVIAEGVEHDDQVKLLQELGCNLLQGYRFAVPIPEGEALGILLRL